LNNREATGKIAKWVIELSMYDIIYKPRTSIKAQALSDFMVEWTETQTPPKERERNIGLSISMDPYKYVLRTQTEAHEQEFW
jgi:hypothetical protein